LQIGKNIFVIKTEFRIQTQNPSSLLHTSTRRLTRKDCYGVHPRVAQTRSFRFSRTVLGSRSRTRIHTTPTHVCSHTRGRQPDQSSGVHSTKLNSLRSSTSDQRGSRNLAPSGERHRRLSSRFTRPIRGSLRATPAQFQARSAADLNP